MSRSTCILAALMVVALPWANGARAEDAKARYDALCASCHGAEHYGGYAPPLLPKNLEHESDQQLVGLLMAGLPNTQMPGFADQLSSEQALSLVRLLRQPVPEIRWGVEQIEASRVDLIPDGPPLPKAVDRAGLILVVERGAGAVVLLDGGSFSELDRFPVGRIHGGPKFDQAYKGIWAVTRLGEVVAYDLDAGGLRARAKVAVNARNIAVSPDGRFVAVASQLPQQLVLLDGDLHPIKAVPLGGQPSGVYQLPGQDRFLITLRDAPRMLLVDYPSGASRWTDLPEAFEDFVFVPGRDQLLASSRDGSRVLHYDLASGEVLSTLETEALPHLFSACFFQRDGELHAALNHIGTPKLSIVRLDGLVVQAEIELAGSGYFVRTHPGTPYLWVDTNTERIQLVDKSTLALHGAGLIPRQGRKAMHVEFTADGRKALVSVWHKDGAVVIYDSTSLKELRRIPFSMPIGKYNAYNKTAQWRTR